PSTRRRGLHAASHPGSDAGWRSHRPIAWLRATRPVRAVRPAGQAMIRVVAYDEELAGRVRAALGDRTDMEERKMFGGLSFMVAGQMCCGVLNNELVVRIEPVEFDTLVAQPSVRP